jgi:hypothetical protein
MYISECCKSLKGCVCFDLERKEQRDPELDNRIANIGVAESQVNKLRRILASRLDRSNPIAFSKGSSTYTFEFGGKEYKITIEVDMYDVGNRSTMTTSSFRNALKSPAFIITCTLFSAAIIAVALVSLYWTSPVLGTFSDRELGILDRQYSQILDRCSAIMNDDRPNNPRSFGPQYSVCNKAIVQLQEFCKVHHHISTCEDERIELYLRGDRART